MSDDLVKRLHEEANLIYGSPPCGLLCEAADRIEQLKAMLETVMRSAGYPDHEINAALGEKKDGQ